MSDWCDSDDECDLSMMRRDRIRQNEQISKSVYRDAIEQGKTDQNYQSGFDVAFESSAKFAAEIGQLKGRLS